MENPKINLRKATLEDFPTLEYWDEQPQVIAASGDDDVWDWEEEIEKNSPFVEILIAEVEGRSIGVVQIIDPANEETHYWGDVVENLRAIDIWIGEPDMLNKGYGSQMMKLGIERCFSEPEVKAIIIDPLVDNKNAIRFYERVGFKFIEYRKFGEDECLVMRLDRHTYFK